jgi:hypothetical protein
MSRGGSIGPVWGSRGDLARVFASLCSWICPDLAPTRRSCKTSSGQDMPTDDRRARRSHGPAFDFLVTYGDLIFSGTPIVFCALNRMQLGTRSLPSNVYGVLVKTEFAPTVELALRIHPTPKDLPSLRARRNSTRDFSGRQIHPRNTCYARMSRNLGDGMRAANYCLAIVPTGK